MYNLKEYSKNYMQTSESVWQYYRDQSALSNDVNIIDFLVNNDTSLYFKYTKNITGKAGNDDIKNIEIWVPLK